MSSSMPIEESDHDDVVDADPAADSTARPARPDWLMGAAEGAQPRHTDDEPQVPQADGDFGPLRLADKLERDERPQLRLVTPASPPPQADAEEQGPEASAPARPGAWKGASSSVPKLRQKPVATEGTPEPDTFAGFAQDGFKQKPASKEPPAEAKAARAPATSEEADATPAPLGGEPSFWVLWLDHLRFIRHPAAIIGAGVLAVGLVLANLLAPRVQEGDSVARIRQQPEAYEGKTVTVGGVAGEAYAVGPNTAFNLYQGRDTIVVYSPALRPGLHDKVRVTGTISVGYLDGAPRVTLLDDAKR